MIIALIDRTFVTGETIESIMEQAINEALFYNEAEFIDAINDIGFYVASEPLHVAVEVQKTHFILS